MGVNTIQEDGGTELSRYLDALSTLRRRCVLYYLHENEVSNVSELAEYVLQCETDRPSSEVSEDERKSVEIDLYHNHLPRLDEKGLVSFDARTKHIRMESTPMVFLGLLWICNTYENPP